MDENSRIQNSQMIKDMEEEARLKEEEEQFEAELAELMKPDQPGRRKKKKKKKKSGQGRKQWSAKRKAITAAVVILAAAGAFKVFGGKKENVVMVSM